MTLCPTSLLLTVSSLLLLLSHTVDTTLLRFKSECVYLGRCFIFVCVDEDWDQDASLLVGVAYVLVPHQFRRK